MVLRMKNFNILRVHWKMRLLGVGGSRKTNIEGGLPKKEGLGQFVDFREGGGLGKKEGGCFWRGWYPNAHYGYLISIARLKWCYEYYDDVEQDLSPARRLSKSVAQANRKQYYKLACTEAKMWLHCIKLSWRDNY